MFPEKIMQETLHDHHMSITMSDRPICNLSFAYISLMGSSNSELLDITNRLLDRATAYEMEVSSENSKIMTNTVTAQTTSVQILA